MSGAYCRALGLLHQHNQASNPAARTSAPWLAHNVLPNKTTGAAGLTRAHTSHDEWHRCVNGVILRYRTTVGWRHVKRQQSCFKSFGSGLASVLMPTRDVFARDHVVAKHHCYQD